MYFICNCKYIIEKLIKEVKNISNYFTVKSLTKLIDLIFTNLQTRKLIYLLGKCRCTSKKQYKDEFQQHFIHLPICIR